MRKQKQAALSLEGCRAKLSSGAAYVSRRAAKLRARRMRSQGMYVDYFRCPHCGLWHVGRPEPWREKCLSESN
jgi:hypothetical protein